MFTASYEMYNKFLYIEVNQFEMHRKIFRKILAKGIGTM